VEHSTFGPYRILELLGRGGMGEVYRAHDSRTDRIVALKVLPARLSSSAEYAARFRRECHSAARLNEPHVLPIHGFGEIDGRLYLDMRLIEGTDLARWLAAHGPLAPDTAVAVLSQVALALDAAHAAGLVHRDVTPSNVLLAGAQSPPLDASTVFAYLFDFGITRPRAGALGSEAAALTRAGVVAGSPAYVAPERLSGVEGDPRADVYSLACVFHQALTGQAPFTGDLPALIGAHLRKPPPRPSAVRPGIAAGFDDVVATGMAKQPDNRFASAGQLAAAARAALNNPGRPSADRPRAVPATAPTLIRRPAADSVSVTSRGADEITVRFGPGVDTSAGSVDRGRGSPSVPPPPSAWSPDPPRRRRSHRRLLNGIVTGLIAVGAVAYLVHRDHGQLQVLGATVAPAAGSAPRCDGTADVVGTIRTNGQPGTIGYRWTRSDGETTDVLTQPVADGESIVHVHLLWRFSGVGHYDATATLGIASPNPVQAAGSFAYDCRR
jgi:serine/threonine-protein kinase